MAIQYYLIDNPLTADPTDYMAVVTTGKSKTLDDLVETIHYKYTKLSESDIKGVLEEFLSAVDFWIREGKSINTPLFNLLPSISGVFYNSDENFDPGKHQLNLNLNPGKQLSKTAQKVTLERVVAPEHSPIITDFLDVASNSRRSQLTPNSPVRIIGDKLKYDNSDAQQGIFFIDESNQEFKATVIVDNHPRKLTIQSPDLSAGTYQLQVRTNMGGKTLRSSLAGFLLTVPISGTPIN
ncbi:MAG: DNA-binding domain-containing protein [Cyclobacteriaceae bacterium]